MNKLITKPRLPQKPRFPRLTKRHWKAGIQVGETEQTLAKKPGWKKLTAEQRLSLIQKAIKETALERRRAQATMEISMEVSFGEEKIAWKRKMEELGQQEQALRLLAGKYRKKIK